jgi:hypothetical protein
MVLSPTASIMGVLSTQEELIASEAPCLMYPELLGAEAAASAAVSKAFRLWKVAHFLKIKCSS